MANVTYLCAFETSGSHILLERRTFRLLLRPPGLTFFADLSKSPVRPNAALTAEEEHVFKGGILASSDVPSF